MGFLVALPCGFTLWFYLVALHSLATGHSCLVAEAFNNRTTTLLTANNSADSRAKSRLSAYFSIIATARVQPADAARILCGKQEIINP